ncbi:MAG: hypothetical protein H6635_06145 [Anaerolineales bacterium]|nr:hypothetical protein [Anaerolineales bacterium]MCB9144932.1 hypothetical protein [Anaerolineales bacterium]
MKYTSLSIQTQREFPNNARSQGWGWLVRAGYLTRENQLLPLGEQIIEKLKARTETAGENAFSAFEIPIITGIYGHILFLTDSGKTEIFKCNIHYCDYADLAETASTNNFRIQTDEPQPMEKVATPDCSTIDSLAKFLNIEKLKTAKAIMLTRVSDGQFVFVVVRGDTQLNLHKLQKRIGEVRPATTEEIIAAGAIPGYASPIGIQNALIVVDEVIPRGINLAAGANEAGYHLINTNYGRDYTADMVFDIVQVEEGDICPSCEDATLDGLKAEILMDENKNFDYLNILTALAETHHDDKGLTLPLSASPFDVYLMHVPGKTVDTKAKAEEIYNALQAAGITVLFDDRDERAGVKFNDADLIGCPLRVTVGEKGLQSGMVELKKRSSSAGKILLEQILTLKNIETLLEANLYEQPDPKV